MAEETQGGPVRRTRLCWYCNGPITFGILGGRWLPFAGEPCLPLDPAGDDWVLAGDDAIEAVRAGDLPTRDVPLYRLHRCLTRGPSTPAWRPATMPPTDPPTAEAVLSRIAFPGDRGVRLSPAERAVLRAWWLAREAEQHEVETRRARHRQRAGLRRVK